MSVSELDEKWAEMLESAVAAATSEGRAEVAEYLRLKSINDAVRKAGVRWLFESVVQIATADTIPGLNIERVEPHNFTFRGANMVGCLMNIRQGVRCLTLEAGWTRTPKDGFMRGGALATARIVHFGMPRHGAELALVRRAHSVRWELVHDQNEGEVLEERQLLEHFELFARG